jgi:hypothetical protein
MISTATSRRALAREPCSRVNCKKGAIGRRNIRVQSCGRCHGKKLKTYGLLRSGDRRSVDEKRPWKLGRRQQSLPPGRGQGEPRSGRHRRDHGEAGRRSQALRWSDGSFIEHAELPTNLCDTDKPTKAARKPQGRKPKKTSSRPVDKAAERKAALDYEREQTFRDRERAREKAARQNDRERRLKAVAKTSACRSRLSWHCWRRVA